MPDGSARAPRKMPAQKPGKSLQSYGTPRVFLDAVERRFGRIQWDLAANETNAICDLWIGERQNSLLVSWAESCSGLLWLNPPFADIDPWAKKCAVEARRGARILLLVPASVGANWYWEHVAPHASVLALAPRLMFDGHVSKKTGKPEPYPKDLILAVYGSGVTGFGRWLWQKGGRG